MLPASAAVSRQLLPHQAGHAQRAQIVGYSRDQTSHTTPASLARSHVKLQSLCRQRTACNAPPAQAAVRARSSTCSRPRQQQQQQPSGPGCCQRQIQDLIEAAPAVTSLAGRQPHAACRMPNFSRRPPAPLMPHAALKFSCHKHLSQVEQRRSR